MISESLRTYLEFNVEPEVRQFCGPVIFTTTLKVAVGNVIASGSFGLVDTGIKKLLVTCFHVWEGFQRARSENPDLKMCLCLDEGNPVVFGPTEPLGQDRGLDVATFDMEPLLSACAERKFYPLHQNPPRRLEIGDTLFLIGFPGYLRVETDKFVAFGRQPYGFVVSSVDGLRFHSDVSRTQKPPSDFPGISGCPCFLVRKYRPIQLVGFAASLAFNRFLGFAHASCLNPEKSGQHCLIPCLTLIGSCSSNRAKQLDVLAFMQLERVKGIEPSFHARETSQMAAKGWLLGAADQGQEHTAQFRTDYGRFSLPHNCRTAHALRTAFSSPRCPVMRHFARNNWCCIVYDYLSECDKPRL
jgi:hypothetical protein